MNTSSQATFCRTSRRDGHFIRNSSEEMSLLALQQRVPPQALHKVFTVSRTLPQSNLPSSALNKSSLVAILDEALEILDEPIDDLMDASIDVFSRDVANRGTLFTRGPSN